MLELFVELHNGTLVPVHYIEISVSRKRIRPRCGNDINIDVHTVTRFYSREHLIDQSNGLIMAIITADNVRSLHYAGTKIAGQKNVNRFYQTIAELGRILTLEQSFSKELQNRNIQYMLSTGIGPTISNVKDDVRFTDFILQ